MFTGIVEACARVRTVEKRGSGTRLVLAAPWPEWQVDPGESISVSGVCLTVAGFADPAGGAPLKSSFPGADLLFDLSAETIVRTWFAELEPGRRVNIERSRRVGERLGGHFVSGHVDGLAALAVIEDSRDGGKLFTFEVDPGLERYLIEKGSIALDGVSLTVVAPRERRFGVSLIPTTLENTTLGTSGLGEFVNVEVDMVGKWIEKLLAERGRS